MAKNRMKEVAELLGVELNEEFYVGENLQEKIMITESGAVYCSNENTSCYLLNILLLGTLEIKRDILDCVEKEYLENFLKPFKNNVSYIIKIKIGEKEAIRICLQYKKDSWCIDLPPFKSEKMYKRMELTKKYTLKDLRLFGKD